MSDQDSLRKIEGLLHEIRAILVLSNQDKLAQAKKALLKEGTVKRQVYDLCDGTKTTQEIADDLKKSPDYFSSYVSILRREGLIRSAEKAGQQTHEQIF